LLFSPHCLSFRPPPTALMSSPPWYGRRGTAPGVSPPPSRGSTKRRNPASAPSQDALGDYAVLPTDEPLAPRRKEGRRASVLRPAAVIDEDKRGWLGKVLGSSSFQFGVALLIISNAIVMGLETDLPTYPIWDMIENAFLVAFLVEFLLKCSSEGFRTLLSPSNPDVAWNICDVVVLGLGFSDLAMTVFLNKSSGNMATLFRIIRLVRIMRLFRLVRFLKQLYLLAFGFVEAVQAIFWVSLLMIVVLYTCSIIMVRTLGSLPDSDPHAEFLHMQFADIRTSMLTLFVLMSSPNLPRYMDQEGLFWERPLLLVFLISFIVVGSFGMTALLTGVISESMFEKNQLRVEETRKEQDDLLDALDTKADEVYATLDLDDKGEASTDEVMSKAMPVIADLFEKAMVEFTDYNLTELVRLMDGDCSGRISCEEFRRAIVTFANGVKPLAIQEVHFNMACCMYKLRQIEGSVAKLLAHLDVDARGASGSISQPRPGKASLLADLGPCSDRAGSYGGSNASTTATEKRREGKSVEIGPGFTSELHISLEAKAGRWGGDSERLQRSLKDLSECVRQYMQTQLDFQREFEAALQHSITSLQGQVQEDLRVVATSWSDPKWLKASGNDAGLRGEGDSACKARSFQDRVGCTSAQPEVVKPSRSEVEDAHLHMARLSKFSNL